MKFNTLKNVVLTSLVVLCLFGIGAKLYQQVRPENNILHNEISQLTIRLNEVDARWDSELLRSRLSIDQSYDALNEKVNELDKLQQQLTQAINNASDSDPRLVELNTDFKNTVANKSALTQSFKTENTTLRESVAFIARDFDTLQKELSQAMRLAHTDTFFLTILRQQLANLQRQLLAYATNAEVTSDASIQATLSAIDAVKKDMEVVGSLPDALNSSLQTVTNHARTIVQQKPIVDQLVSDVNTTPTTAKLGILRQSYQELYEAQNAISDYYRNWFYLFLALLAIGFALLTLRYFNQRKLDALAGANELLAKQAQELSSAYDQLKMSQAQLVQSEKMSSLGQMVAGVAHEINTPLAYCSGNLAVVDEQFQGLDELVTDCDSLTDMLRNRKKDDLAELKAQLRKILAKSRSLQKEDVLDEMAELLQDSKSALGEISEMVTNLKNFSRLDRKKTDQVDLNECLDSALMIAKNKLSNNIHVVKNYAELPAISCAPSQLNQVFLNMLINASQAIEEEGTITVSTAARDNNVEVIIQDTGVGIASDVLPHIFDPFYTTKDVGEGTGLGLSICYQIIEQHNGTIDVDSTSEQGTRFIISLPIMPIAKETNRQLSTEVAA